MHTFYLLVTVALTFGHFDGNGKTGIAGSVVSGREGRKHLILKPLATTTLPTTTAATTPSTASTTVTFAPVSPTVPTPIPLKTGIGCGTIQMRPFDLLRINSNNYPDFYPTDDACTWKFLATDCIISAECPCFNIPSSFECIEDYLKIVDLPYHQRFCGPTEPQGVYFASSDKFTVRFRSNKRTTGRGFACYVQCTPAGFARLNTSDTPTNQCPLGL